MEKEMQKGGVMKSPISKGNEIKGVMKAPKADGEKNMGGVMKGAAKNLGSSDTMAADMGRAVKHLNRQTGRTGGMKERDEY